MPEFQPYLDTIARHYDQWWRLYTLTDAEGKEERSAAPLFDFGLVVQTITPKDSPEFSDRPRPKIERFPVTKGLQKYAIDHVLLVGRPGSGKSTALARLMLDLVRSSQIPVLVELRSYQSSVLELIRSSFKRHDLSLTIAQIEMLLDDRKLILLIDGVNELPSESARMDLSNFRRNYSKVSMIFTTRDLSLGGNLGIEKQLEMQPLTETQMRSFINAYLPGKADAMLGQLKDRLREFGTTPLLLWMLCSLFKRTEVIPQNLGEVFRAFTRGYEQQIKHDVVLESDRRLWFDLLKQLAVAMMQGEKPTEFRVAIAPAEICAVFADYLKTENPLVPRQALDDLLKHHLIQRNGELVEFRHQLIQEYYAAEWLLERIGQLDDETLECDYLNYLKWTEPLALMLALVDDEALAVRVVENALAVDPYLGAKLIRSVRKVFNIQFSRLLVENIKTHSYTIPEKFKQGLIKYSLRYSDSESRNISTQTTVCIPNLYQDTPLQDMYPYHEVNDDELKNILKDLNNSDVKILAKVLGKIQYGCDSRILETLIKISSNAWDAQDRYIVEKMSKILCNFRSPEILNCLLEGVDKIVGSNPSSKLRKSYHRNLIIGLGKIGGQEAFSRLKSLLKYDNQQVKHDSVNALHHIQHKDKILLLCETLEDPSLGVCISAVNILTQIGNPKSLRFIYKFHVEKYDNFHVENLWVEISLMQLHFKFYNYEIYRKAIGRTSTATARGTPEVLAGLAETVKQIRSHQMTEPSRTFNVQGNYIEKNEGGYHEHNYVPEPNTKPTDQLTNLLVQLRTKYPDKTDAEIFDILLNGFDAMPQKNPQSWQRWQDILSVLFSGGIEATKLLVPVAGIPIEVIKRLYEIYDRNSKQLPGA